MTATAQRVLDFARSQLGVVEGPRSNENPYNTWYYGKVVYGSSYPWCAVFISYTAFQTGALDIIPKHAYTPSGVAWFKARGQFHSRPQVGDLVYMNAAGLGRVSHVGIVEVVHSDGSWTAIEGNTDSKGGRTGGRVMRQRRSKVGAGGGFGRPNYAPPQSQEDNNMNADQDARLRRLEADVQELLKQFGRTGDVRGRNSGWVGWPQLGGLSLVDAVAAIKRKTGA